jgi:Immunity protein 51
MPGYRLERGGYFPSPDGKIVISASSQSFEDGQVMTQASASHQEEGWGSGLIAFLTERVEIFANWITPHHVEISYPETTIPYDGGALGIDRISRDISVEYKAVPPDQIPKLDWHLEIDENITIKSKQLPRGKLITIRRDDTISYRYDYYDSDEPDSHADLLTQRGFQAGGESWFGIVYGLIQLKSPRLWDSLQFDPEASGLSITSAKKSALLKIAEWIALAKNDDTLLAAAIAAAQENGMME